MHGVANPTKAAAKKMNTATDYTDYNVLFDSYREAGQAFQRLLEKGIVRSDRELSRDADYLKLHKSGMRIAVIGGESAIKGAINAICKTRADDPVSQRAELERLWCGMGRWTQ